MRKIQATLCNAECMATWGYTKFCWGSGFTRGRLTYMKHGSQDPGNPAQ